MMPTPFARAAAMISRGLAGPSKNFSAPGEFEQIGDALHRRRCGGVADKPNDRVGMADAGHSPGADQPLGDQLVKDRADMRGKRLVERHPRGGVGPTFTMDRIGHDIGMQEEQIEMRQSQPA